MEQQAASESILCQTEAKIPPIQNPYKRPKRRVRNQTQTKLYTQACQNKKERLQTSQTWKRSELNNYLADPDRYKTENAPFARTAKSLDFTATNVKSCYNTEPATNWQDQIDQNLQK